jgi:acetyl esterase/lipase
MNLQSPFCSAALALVLGASALMADVRAADDPQFTRQEDVVYGRKDGMALTLDVFTPKKGANDAAVIWVISGGWFSSHDSIGPGTVLPLLKRGYTVFAVVHGSQPRYTIPDAVADMHRSIRFIRANAQRFKIDANRIGIMGGSAGGHLSLMMGTTGDDGNPASKDPVERTSDRIQAVACFFPPTDFLNYGREGNIVLGDDILKNFKAPFDFKELDPATRAYVPITDRKRQVEIGRAVSPLYHVTKDDAPSLIMHGDADKLVPIQQAEQIVAKFKEAGVPVELVVKPGAEHGWPNMGADIERFADWFDKYLAKPAK